MAHIDFIHSLKGNEFVGRTTVFNHYPAILSGIDINGVSWFGDICSTLNRFPRCTGGTGIGIITVTCAYVILRAKTKTDTTEKKHYCCHSSEHKFTSLVALKIPFETYYSPQDTKK